jgi:hypothetical protein
MKKKYVVIAAAFAVSTMAMSFRPVAKIETKSKTIGAIKSNVSNAGKINIAEAKFTPLLFAFIITYTLNTSITIGAENTLNAFQQELVSVDMYKLDAKK